MSSPVVEAMVEITCKLPVRLVQISPRSLERNYKIPTTPCFNAFIQNLDQYVIVKFYCPCILID